MRSRNAAGKEIKTIELNYIFSAVYAADCGLYHSYITTFVWILTRTSNTASEVCTPKPPSTRPPTIPTQVSPPPKKASLDFTKRSTNARKSNSAEWTCSPCVCTTSTSLHAYNQTSSQTSPNKERYLMEIQGSGYEEGYSNPHPHPHLRIKPEWNVDMAPSPSS